MMRTATHLGPLIATVLAFSVACGGDDSGGGGANCTAISDGGFEISIAGQDIEWCGPTSRLSTNGPWGFSMLSDLDTTIVTLGTGETAPPTPGTYPIEDFVATGGNAPVGSFVGFSTVDAATGLPAGTYNSLSGSVTIIASSSTEVSGSFSLTAQANGSTADPVELTGEFLVREP